jgi:hypothetical protein
MKSLCHDQPRDLGVPASLPSWWAGPVVTVVVEIGGGVRQRWGRQWRSQRKIKGLEANSFSPLFVLFLMIFVSWVHKFGL